MTTEKDAPRTAKSASETNSLFVVVRTIGSTTWRMFGPVVAGALLGWWIDSTYHTTWATLAGSIVGLGAASLLVWRQYRDVAEDRS